MILTWMLAATALAALLFGAAWALERALRLIGWQGRAPWIVALVAAIAWPVLASLAAPATVQSVAVRTLTASSQLLGVAPAAPEDVLSAVLARLALLDQPLILLWIVGSLLLLARVLWAVVALRQTAQAATPSELAGTAVRITPTLGPAVFALWRAQVLLPSWMLDLEAPLRALVLEHEREHVRSRDAQLVIASHLAAALMPWNAPLWWIARRLRTAAEVDCDTRVLRGGVDAGTYSHLLLLIAQRQGHARFLPMMAGAPSTLRARIIAMSSPRPERPALRAALFTLAAATLVGASASPVLARPLASVHLAESVSALLPAAPQVQQPQQARPKPGISADSAKRALDATVARKAAAARTKGAADTLAMKEKKDAVAKGYKEFKLDKPAVMARGSKVPRYPNELRKANVTGSVLAMFVVDTTGYPDASSLKIVRATHPDFVEAVRSSFVGLNFLPAEVGGRPVRQLVQMLYRFATFSTPHVDSLVLVKDVTAFEMTVTGNDQLKGDPTGTIVGMTFYPSGPDPLYIVDGKRTTAEEAKNIDKARIASVEVLKNEAARAKYGDDGKNGVIIITLKQ